MRKKTALAVSLVLACGGFCAQAATESRQPLSEALASFARSSGVQIIYESSLTQDLMSQGAPAGLSREETLQRLLEGTGLTYRFLNDRTVSINGRRYAQANIRGIAATDAELGGFDGETIRLAQADEPAPEPQRINEGELAEVTVTARFREENLQQAPLAITALSAESLTDMGFTDLSQVGRAIPNTYFRQQSAAYGRSTAMFIRGVGQADFQFSQEPRTSMYIDDVYFATVFGSMFDLLDLERVEVLRGPQGTLFGRNSMGGAVRMISKQPKGDNTGRLDVSYGADDRIELRASYDTALIQDRLFLRLAGSAKKRSGYVDQVDFTCDMIARGTPQLAGLGDGMLRLRDRGANGILEATDPYLPDRLPPANQIQFNPDYLKVFGTNVVGNAGTAYGYTPGPNGDYPADLNPGIDAVSLATARSDDNALSFPARIDSLPVGGSRNCLLGTFGGEDVQAARAVLRFVASDKLEFNITGFYSDDNSEPTPISLFDIGDGMGTSNTVPGTTTGLGNIVALNDVVNYPRWGIPYDARFLTGDPFKSYATFENLATGRQWPWHSTSELYGGSVVTDYTFRDNLRAKWIVAFHHTYGEFGDDRDESPLQLQDVWNTVEATEKSTELRFSGEMLAGKLDWTAGGFYWEAEQDNGAVVNIIQLALTLLPNGMGGFAPIVPFWNTQDEADSNNKGVYLNTIYDLTDRLALTGGLRWSKDVKDFFFRHQFEAQMRAGGESTDWKVGLDYRFSDNMMVFGSVATGYTSSSFNARPFSPAQFISQPQEDLTNYEIGSKMDLFDNRLRLNTNVFFADYGMRIIGAATTVQPSGIPLTLPVVSPAEVFGVELEWSANPIRGFIVGGTAGYLDFKAEEAVGDGAPGIPDWQLSANMSYRIAFPGGGTITPRIDAFYTGDVFLNVAGQNKQEAYTLANARITYEAPDSRWALGFEVTNLTDEYYALSAYDLRTAGLNTGNNVPGRGREWAITANYTF
jgi:outer membrane receptor protein involved in Fe transport